MPHKHPEHDTGHAPSDPSPSRSPSPPIPDPVAGPSHSQPSPSPPPPMSIIPALPNAPSHSGLGFHVPRPGPSSPSLADVKGKGRASSAPGRSISPPPSGPRSGRRGRKRSASDVVTPPQSHLSAPALYPAPSSSREPSPPPRRHAAAADLLPLLCCPCCPPGTPIVAPTTLLCGHTVCAVHVTAPSPSSSPDSAAQRPTMPPTPTQPQHTPIPTCPVPTCVRAPSRVREVTPSLAAGSQASITFYPTPRMDAFLSGGRPGTVIRVLNPKVDTTVASLMGIVERAVVEEAEQRREEEEESVLGYPEEDESSDEDEREPEPEQEEGRDRGSAPGPPSPRLNRPHKRPRRQTRLPGHAPRNPFSAQASATAPGGGADADSDMTKLEKELMGELLCSMCYLLLYEPVTTPCQHTFCAKCLQRSLDHGSSCPLCREEMPGFSYHQDHPNNKVVLSLILTAFPEAYTDRRLQLELEARNSRLDTPIFYPLLAFPGMPTMLHLFEPRYRLMLRRVMEDQTFRFGAIATSRTHSEGMEYGTMMEIRSVQMFPDGRSMLETVGTWRFRIVERGHLDGYIVGKIERVDDYPREVEIEVEQNILSPARASRSRSRSPETVRAAGSSVSATPITVLTPSAEEPTPTVISAPPSDAPALSASATPAPDSAPGTTSATPPPADSADDPTVEQLLGKCHAFVDTLRSGSAPWVVQRLDTTYGDAPTDPSAYSFWIAAIMPIDEAEKAKLLPIRSTKLRLRLIVHWIEQLSNNWWFSNGCVIA